MSETNNVKAKCENCKFYVYPQCRKKAPIVLVYDSIGIITRWPEVYKGDWCGEYEKTNLKEPGSND